MKSIQQRILTFIHEHGPADSRTIRAALPDLTRHQVNSGIYFLRDGGMAASDGSKPARYRFVRWPRVRPELTAEARRVKQRVYSARNRAKKSPEELERLRERARERYHANKAKHGIRDRAKWLADVKANAKPKPAPKKPKAPKKPRASVSRPAREQPGIRRHFVRPVPGTLNAAPKQRPAMTSDDFIRQGGRVERIPAPWEKAA